MNDDEKKTLLKLLQNKKECLQKILDMTEERKFEVVEDDVERFYNFFQKREVLFQKCRSLDEKIGKFDVLGEDRNSLFYKDVEKINLDIKDIAKKIIFIDEKNKAVMKELMELVKRNMRNLQRSKQVRKGYGEFPYFDSYGGFDSKK